MSEHILERSGCPIHYWLDGPEGRPLIALTHGAIVDRREFEPQVSALINQYRVLTWDVRGHGQSQPLGENWSVRAAAEDLIAILDQIGSAQPFLLGHSMGGNIVQELVFYHPERARALVMLDCACNTLKLTPLEALTPSLSPWMFRIYPYVPMRRQMARASTITPEAQEYIYQPSGQVSRGDFPDLDGARTRPAP